MEKCTKDLINALWFVVCDLNTTLDYEARLIICGTIAEHTGIDYHDLVNMAMNREEVDFEEYISMIASHENAMEDAANRRLSCDHYAGF